MITVSFTLWQALMGVVVLVLMGWLMGKTEANRVSEVVRSIETGHKVEGLLNDKLKSATASYSRLATQFNAGFDGLLHRDHPISTGGESDKGQKPPVENAGGDRGGGRQDDQIDTADNGGCER